MKGDCKKIDKIVRIIKNNVKHGWDFSAYDSDICLGDNQDEEIITFHVTLRRDIKE